MNPRHPGELAAEDVLKPLGPSITQAAHALGVGREASSAVLNGGAKLTPKMVGRVHKAFGPKRDVLTRLQWQYDVTKMGKRAKNIRAVERYRRNAA